jgi:hypothetical protein
VPDAVAEKLAREQDSIIPAGVPRAKHRANERTDNPRTVPSPGDLHALPNFRLTHQRTCFPVRTETPQERADARKWTLTSAADVKPNMRPGALTAREIYQVRSHTRRILPASARGSRVEKHKSAARKYAGRFIQPAGEIFSRVIPFHNGNNIDCDIEYRIAHGNGEKNGAKGKRPARR